MFVMQLIYHREVGFLRWKIVTEKFGGNIRAAEGENLAVLCCGGILSTHIIRCDIVADTQNYPDKPRLDVSTREN